MVRRKKDIIENPIGVSIDLFEEEFFQEQPNSSQEHPTPEQLMIRQALNRLTPKQKEVWVLWNYDRLSQDEIAKALGIDRTSVEDRIRCIERKIIKYCQQRMKVYEVIKEQEQKKARLVQRRKVQAFHDNDSKY